MTELDRIAALFIGFYQNSGCALLPTAPMLHPSVPMSFVLSAGLVQVETGLSGGHIQPGDKYVLLQNCFRHFDLETVGTDDTHLSMFKMAGAFTFGSTDRLEPLQKIWRFITEILGIKKDRLWVSYFGGGIVDGRHERPEDTLTYKAWKEIGVADARLVKLGPGDNFWLQRDGGKVGTVARKCGPHTELFYDFGESKTCGPGCLPGCPCGRFMEFSNILFIENELSQDARRLTASPLPFVETVIGVERCASAIHNVPSVFNIEPYKALSESFNTLSMSTELSPDKIIQAKRILLDHLRAICILVQDGAPPPGKGGRQRLMRKLFRRVMTQHLLLGLKPEEFLPKLTLLLSNYFSNLCYHAIFPQVKKIYHKEYDNFVTTLTKGKAEFSRLYNTDSAITDTHYNHLQQDFGIPQDIILNLWVPKESDNFHECIHKVHSEKPRLSPTATAY